MEEDTTEVRAAKQVAVLVLPLVERMKDAVADLDDGNTNTARFKLNEMIREMTVE